MCALLPPPPSGSDTWNTTRPVPLEIDLVTVHTAAIYLIYMYVASLSQNGHASATGGKAHLSHDCLHGLVGWVPMLETWRYNRPLMPVRVVKQGLWLNSVKTRLSLP